MTININVNVVKETSLEFGILQGDTIDLSGLSDGDNIISDPINFELRISAEENNFEEFLSSSIEDVIDISGQFNHDNDLDG